MTKRKKKEEVLDTKAGDIMLDTNAPNDDVEQDGVTLKGGSTSKQISSDAITCYMRISKDLLDHIKQIARERSYNEQKDITHQMLIIDALEKVYPMSKEK